MKLKFRKGQLIRFRFDEKIRQGRITHAFATEDGETILLYYHVEPLTVNESGPTMVCHVREADVLEVIEEGN